MRWGLTHRGVRDAGGSGKIGTSHQNQAPQLKCGCALGTAPPLVSGHHSPAGGGEQGGDR